MTQAGSAAHECALFETDATSGFLPEIDLPTAVVLREREQEWCTCVRTPEGRERWLWMDQTTLVMGRRRLRNPLSRCIPSLPDGV